MEPLSVLSYAAIFIIVVVFLYYYGTRSARKLEAHFPGLPGPKPWPFIGNMPDFVNAKGQLHLYFDNQFKKYGRLYSMSFGGVPCIVTTDPEMLKEILVKHFNCFHDRPKLFKLAKPLNNSMNIARGEDWKRIRSTLSPSFSAHKLKGMTSLMNLACDTLIKKIDQAAETEESFNITSFQQAVTMDTIMSTAFGIQTDFQNNPDDPVLQTAVKAMKPNPILSFIGNAVMPILPYGSEFVASEMGSRIFFKELYEIADVAQNVVDIRRKGGDIHKDLLDLMLNATSDNKTLSDDEVVAQSVVFLVAGYETSSTTLAMTCYNLATNPDVQERLQQEIDSVWTDEDTMPSYETVHELPYLDMVISETLRHCPPGFFLMRECTKECTIKGLKIPKDTVIIVPAYTLHRDPEFYPEPEKFDPERFSVKSKESRDPYTYLAFGQGPRNCIGMRFAQMEMKLVLVRLLKKFSFVMTPETKPPILVARVTLSPKDGMILGARKRKIQ